MVEFQMRPTNLDAEEPASPSGGWLLDYWALGFVTRGYFRALEGAALAFARGGSTQTRGGSAARIGGGGTASPSESSAGVSWSLRERLSPANEGLSGHSPGTHKSMRDCGQKSSMALFSSALR